MSRQLVVQVCLSSEEDMDFLKEYARERGLSLSAAFLDMAEFYDKKNRAAAAPSAKVSVIKGVMLSRTPLEDYKEY